MAYRDGDRRQMAMLPPVIEDYVGPKDPVRAYDVIVEAMDCDQMGLTIDRSLVGNPAYDPKSMLKLLVYGYSYGWHSSRKLERACHHNLSFIWLMGGLKPDHKTIANFRRGNQQVLRKVLEQTARICLKMNLIEGNCLFTDSTKMKGAAATSRTLTRKAWEQKLAETDKAIEELLARCEQIDRNESGNLVEMKEELEDRQKLQSKIKGLVKQLDKEKLSRINSTDPECLNVKGRQGTYAGYSAHITVDEQHGLIVNADVVAEANDSNQFSQQIEQAMITLGKPCRTAVADAGYSNMDNLKRTTEKQIDVIVPTQRQALHSPQDSPFDKSKFRYDEQADCYECPEGKKLKYSHYSRQKSNYLYRMEKPALCLKCRYWGTCTISKRGRTVIRLKEEKLREALEARYASAEGQEIYQKRKARVESPFGHIKRNLNCGNFLLKGLAGVKAEWGLLAGSFNIARMITLSGGVSGLLRRLERVETG